MSKTPKCPFCDCTSNPISADGSRYRAKCGTVIDQDGACVMRTYLCERDQLRQVVREVTKRLAELDRVNFYDDANYVWNAIAVTQILLREAVGDE